MVLDIPDDGPALLAPVVAGTLPLVGINEHGAAFGTMSLSATDERVGVPRALVARGVLDARDRDDAFARATRAGRAGGYSYLAPSPAVDAFVIESTATTAAVLEITAHTNHALDPAVAAVACEPSAGSRRGSRGLARWPAAAPTVEGMRGPRRPRRRGPGHLRPSRPAEGDEGSTILFAMICEPETRSMWVAPGHPCTGPFERFAVAER